MSEPNKKIVKDVNEINLRTIINSITEKIITEENTDSVIVKRVRKLREKRENKIRQERQQMIERLQEIYLKEKT